ncbi:MAG: virulence RhuM family protein [Verrucomicrobiales bacterium]|nr:virulence RhuM family protein [Verrucomicrobiales bacterium]
MANELIFYKTPDGEQRIEVVYEDEDFWMSQRALAELFSVKVPAISKHLKNIFESGELAEEQVVSILETTTQHGAIAGKTQTQKVKFYSLDAIIAVGYRVNSYPHVLGEAIVPENPTKSRFPGNNSPWIPSASPCWRSQQGEALDNGGQAAPVYPNIFTKIPFDL